MKNLTTPVLFLCFNRPEKTQQVFDSIRKVRPIKLYVAIDAPRDGRQDDIENCNRVKEIVHNVDWPCEAHYLEREKNLGCSMSGYTAWKWIMETEDRMIFIEDDGLGNESAFYFVQEMLERYKDDERVAYVGAVNYGPTYGDASYFFSLIPCCTYFMGTWKRVLDKYEYEVESFKNVRWTYSFYKNCTSLLKYFDVCGKCSSYLRSIKKGNRLNTYDVQMIYLCRKYNMYSINPNINMVSNIGLDGGANNHCSVESDFYKEYANRQKFEMREITHTELVKIDKNFEDRYYIKRCHYNDTSLWKHLQILKRYIENILC